MRSNIMVHTSLAGKRVWTCTSREQDHYHHLIGNKISFKFTHSNVEIPAIQNTTTLYYGDSHTFKFRCVVEILITVSCENHNFINL